MSQSGGKNGQRWCRRWWMSRSMSTSSSRMMAASLGCRSLSLAIVWMMERCEYQHAIRAGVRIENWGTVRSYGLRVLFCVAHMSGGVGVSEAGIEERKPGDQGSMYSSWGGMCSGQMKGSESVDSRVVWTEWRMLSTIGLLVSMACM